MEGMRDVRWGRFIGIGLAVGLVLAFFVWNHGADNICQAKAQAWAQYHPDASPSDVEAVRELC